MAIVNKPNTFSGNTTISSSEVNSNFDTLYNEFNGSISAANLADDAVTSAKLADNAVVAANIQADAVTATKIDWASTGADGGIWWEELGRTTLGSAGDTISVTSLPARKYLQVLIYTINSGSVAGRLRFNNDSSNNYAYRYSIGSAGAASSTSQSSIGYDVSIGGSGNYETYATVGIFNLATRPKTCLASSFSDSDTASAANQPEIVDVVGKWVNATDSITRIDVVNSGAGDFAIGSEVVVLGHN